MGVYIKGMKMPENCLECVIRAYDANAGEEYCPFSQMECLSIGLQKNCPMVEVSEPHGRLIDADALMNIFADRIVKVSERYGIYSAVAGAVSGAMKLLDVQPTVIEAEGEG